MMTSPRFRSRVQEFELLLLSLLPLLLLPPPPSSSCCDYFCYCYCYNCCNYYSSFSQIRSTEKAASPELALLPSAGDARRLGETFDAAWHDIRRRESFSGLRYKPQLPISRLVGYIIGRISLHCALWTGTHYVGNWFPR